MISPALAVLTSIFASPWWLKIDVTLARSRRPSLAMRTAESPTWTRRW